MLREPKKPIQVRGTRIGVFVNMILLMKRNCSTQRIFWLKGSPGSVLSFEDDSRGEDFNCVPLPARDAQRTMTSGRVKVVASCFAAIIVEENLIHASAHDDNNFCSMRMAVYR